MAEYIQDTDSRSNVYCKKYIKQLLKDHYKENIIICSKGPGKDDLISFQNMATYLINVKCKDRDDSVNDKITR